MLRAIALPAMLLSISMLGACGGTAEDNKTTETRMDDIDSVEGTISDDSINTDESTEEGLIDPSAPIDATGKTSAKTDDKKADGAKTDSVKTDSNATDAAGRPQGAVDPIKKLEPAPTDKAK